MWTSEHRLAARRVGQRYDSDLTDEEWALVERLIPPGKRGGGKRTVNIREVLNGIFYVLWREWVHTFLQTYRLHPESGSFERLQRRAVLEGLQGNGMCLRSDGKEVAIWATTIDDALDLLIHPHRLVATLRR